MIVNFVNMDFIQWNESSIRSTLTRTGELVLSRLPASADSETASKPIRYQALLERRQGITAVVEMQINM